MWFSKCLLNNKKKYQEIIKIQNVTLITAEDKNEKTEQLATFIALWFLSLFPNVDRIRYFKRYYSQGYSELICLDDDK